jgi:predicted site-specific integrase-resolvase
MLLPLAEAAQRVGLHRSNLLRAIKSGRVSGSRDDGGNWQIDTAQGVTATMLATRIIVYIRVSTAQQGRSGLGLDAQREAIARFALPASRQVPREPRC